ncbi:MAG: hypothetical protein QOJ15_10255 [Bradyrhizobium sp.]|nr:hypothetical protein [Bradyrhizobium sp.]
MRRIGFLVSILFLLMSAAALPAAAETRVALVVGNANYRNVPSLTNPADDARLMAGTLKSLGFRLVGDEAQIDLDKIALDAAVRSFGNQLRGADVGLFYYAGHGLQVRGANYLVPVGANPVREADVDFELEDVALVLRQMEASGTRLNLVMLDACRNNPFGGRGLRAIDSGLAQMRAPEGTLISFATQPGNVAQDGINGNSPYSKALAQTIRKPGLGVFDAFNEVGLTVKKATGGEQQPWVSSSPIDGSFYFAGLSKADDARPTATMTLPKDSATAASIEGAAVRLQSKPAAAAALPSTESSVASTKTQDDAAQAWSAIKDTTSQAAVEDFTRTYGSTPYGAIARARLQELKQTQVAAVSPVQGVPALPSEEGRKTERGLAIYNGKWAVVGSGSCTPRTRGHLSIKDGVISGPEGGGRIYPDGHVTGHFASAGLINGRFSGRMSSSSSGGGTWSNVLGCAGDWSISR